MEKLLSILGKKVNINQQEKLPYWLYVLEDNNQKYIASYKNCHPIINDVFFVSSEKTIEICISDSLPAEQINICELLHCNQALIITKEGKINYFAPIFQNYSDALGFICKLFKTMHAVAQEKEILINRLTNFLYANNPERNLQEEKIFTSYFHILWTRKRKY